MNRTDQVKRIIWLDALATAAKAEAAKLRADLYADARADYEEQGTAATWRIPDVATVATAVSHQSVHVSDEAAFTQWVADRYPTEIETVARVRSSWSAAFVASTAPFGEAACDPSTGEVVPGLKVRMGGEFSGLSIRVTPTAKEVFAAVAGAHLGELTATAPLAVTDA